MEGRSTGALVTVRSSAVDLGDVLPERVQDAVIKLTSKYFDNLSGASVYFSREGLHLRCSVNVQVGSLDIIKGQARHPDAYLSFEIALEKVTKQLRRKKQALRDDKNVSARSDAGISPMSFA